MTDIIFREWESQTIRQREDGYISLTDMAKVSNKDYYEWSRLSNTISYLDKLGSFKHTGESRLLIEVVKSGSMSSRGTWGHRKVAIRFAQWCNDDFAIQVDSWVEEILIKGYVIANKDDDTLAKVEAEIAIYKVKNAELKTKVNTLSMIAKIPLIDDIQHMTPERDWYMFNEAVTVCENFLKVHNPDLCAIPMKTILKVFGYTNQYDNPTRESEERKFFTEKGWSNIFVNDVCQTIREVPPTLSIFKDKKKKK